MKKAKAASILSATVVANMAAVGLAASPAGASANLEAAVPPSNAATTTVPSIGGHLGLTAEAPGRAHIEKTKLSPPQLRQSDARLARQATAAGTKPRGFVPRATPGAIPNTETGCTGNVCVGLIGGGNTVSSFNEHFFGNSGCHIPHLYITYPNGTTHNIWYNSYWCSKQEVKFIFPDSFNAGFFGTLYATGTRFCGSFQNVPGRMCEVVR